MCRSVYSSVRKQVCTKQHSIHISVEPLKKNMKKITTLILSIASFISVNAQHFEWVKTIDGVNQVTAIITDESENIYSTGYFSGTVNFDPGVGLWTLTAIGQWDIFITKMNAAGDFEWIKQIGGPEYERSSSIALDEAGNIYITGGFQDTVDFNPATGISDTSFLSATGLSFDIFVLKLDSNGIFKWAKKIGGPNNDLGHAITADSESSVYITGRFIETVDFDPDSIGSYVLTSSGFEDAFICKLDSLGDYCWAMKIGEADYDCGESIKVDKDNNIYAAGGFSGTVDFDPGSGVYNLTSLSGSLDPYFIKLSKTGNLIWAKSFESPYWTYSQVIDVDYLGNVFCAGGYQILIDVDPGLGLSDTCFFHSGGSYISKLDSSGNFMWAKQFQGVCRILSIDLDDDNNIYTTGDFGQLMDFDPDDSSTFILSGYDSDVFISKLDSSGAFSWVAQIAGDQTCEVGLSLSVKNGNVYCGGIFTGSVDFDPSATAEYWLTSTVGNNNSFIHKMYQCSLDVSVTQNNLILTANASGATYQWLDCNNSYSAIAGETNQSFNVTQNGSYAVEITQNACVDTSVCCVINNVGILENFFGNAITVYPNPVNEELTIAANDNIEPISFRILNAVGQEIYNGVVVDKTIVNTNNFASGVYFVRFENGKTVEFKKIVKD